MANRLALDMGLNFDSASVVTSAWLTKEEMELRRRIYWTLYCIDKSGSMYTGRVCTMLVGLFEPFARDKKLTWSRMLKLMLVYQLFNLRLILPPIYPYMKHEGACWERYKEPTSACHKLMKECYLHCESNQCA